MFLILAIVTVVTVVATSTRRGVERWLLAGATTLVALSLLAVIPHLMVWDVHPSSGQSRER